MGEPLGKEVRLFSTTDSALQLRVRPRLLALSPPIVLLRGLGGSWAAPACELFNNQLRLFVAFSAFCWLRNMQRSAQLKTGGGGDLFLPCPLVGKAVCCCCCQFWSAGIFWYSPFYEVGCEVGERLMRCWMMSKTTGKRPADSEKGVAFSDPAKRDQGSPLFFPKKV